MDASRIALLEQRRAKQISDADDLIQKATAETELAQKHAGTPVGRMIRNSAVGKAEMAQTLLGNDGNSSHLRYYSQRETAVLFR